MVLYVCLSESVAPKHSNPLKRTNKAMHDERLGVIVTSSLLGIFTHALPGNITLAQHFGCGGNAQGGRGPSRGLVCLEKLRVSYFFYTFFMHLSAAQNTSSLVKNWIQFRMTRRSRMHSHVHKQLTPKLHRALQRQCDLDRSTHSYITIAQLQKNHKYQSRVIASYFLTH